MSILKITDLNIKNKRVLIRSDLNVPIKNQIITSDAKILASLPTIITALKEEAIVLLTSHLGRPKEGEYNSLYSLKPIVDYLKKILNIPIILIKDYLQTFNIPTKKNQLVVLENVRFNQGEKENDDKLSKKYANMCDIFVMDAFGASHRKESSTYGISKFVKSVCIGLLLNNELKALNKALAHPTKPVVSIVGGAKVSTKLKIISKLSKLTDIVIVGGGIANSFIAAQGHNVGQSLCDYKFLTEIKNLLSKTNNIIIPIDVIVSLTFSASSIGTLKLVNNINYNERILDIGNLSLKHIITILKKAKTILWNGPVGVFEFPNFSKGTQIIAKTIAKSNAFSIAGGGDTIAAINFFKINKNISYISTGGGAFLEFIKNKELPTVEIIKQRNK